MEDDSMLIIPGRPRQVIGRLETANLNADALFPTRRPPWWRRALDWLMRR